MEADTAVVEAVKPARRIKARLPAKPYEPAFPVCRKCHSRWDPNWSRCQRDGGSILEVKR